MKLGVNEVAVLEQLVPLLVVEGGWRLSPTGHLPVYPGRPEDDAEFWRLMGDELRRAKAEDRATFIETLGAAQRGVVLSEDQAEAWLRVMGEARLVLAARLGIEHEDDYEAVRDGGGPEMAVLDYLSYLQASLSETLGKVLG